MLKETSNFRRVRDHVLIEVPVQKRTSFPVRLAGIRHRIQVPAVDVLHHPSLLDTVFYACALAPRVTVCGAKPRVPRREAQAHLSPVQPGQPSCAQAQEGQAAGQ